MSKNVIVLVSVLILCVGAQFSQLPASDEKAKNSSPEKVILILPFRVAGEKAGFEALGEGLQELLIVDLSSFEEIKVVDRKALGKILKEQALTLALMVKADNQIKIGKIAGATLILTGTFSIVDSKIKINAHLYDIASSRLARSSEVEGDADKWLEAEQELARNLVKGLELKMTEVQEKAIEKKPKVNKYYIRGIGYYAVGNYDYAIMEFMNTLWGDEKYVDARYYIAMSYLALKENDHARIEFEKVIREFPESDFAREAKKQLEGMGS